MWLSLVPIFVQAAEVLFGPKTGPIKLDTVLNWLKIAIANLTGAGKFTGTTPTTDELATEINKAVAKQFPSGTTAPAALPIPVTADKITVLKSLINWALAQL